jgi:hypothetical protein
MAKTLYKLGLAQQLTRAQTQSELLVNNKPFIKRIFKKMQARIRLVPATLAILIQCSALVMVLIFCSVASLIATAYFSNDLSFSVLDLVLMQALTATTLSYLTGMANWWRWIHLCFPLAAWGMSQWHVPNEIYLTGFIISLSLFWTTFRTQVPFFPSRPVVWQQVAKIIPQSKPVRLIDIGSGLGDMSMYMAKARPDSQIEGIEIAPLPWLISFIRAKFRRSSAVFKLGDYTTLDFANYDVIFAYLSPAVMVNLWEKANREMKAGSLLISLEFEIPDVVPSIRIAASKNSPAIYVWKIA